MPISWNTIIFKFRLIFAIDERRIVSGMAFHMVVWLLGKPTDACQQKKQYDIIQINGLHQNWKAFPDTILRSLVARIKRNLKMTVFQEIGIESKLLNQIQWSWYHSLLQKML